MRTKAAVCHHTELNSRLTQINVCFFYCPALLDVLSCFIVKSQLWDMPALHRLASLNGHTANLCVCDCVRYMCAWMMALCEYVYKNVAYSYILFIIHFIIHFSAGEMNGIRAACSQSGWYRVGVQRGHEGQRKGADPTLAPTWKLIRARTAHGIRVAIKVTLANNNDFQTIFWLIMLSLQVTRGFATTKKTFLDWSWAPHGHIKS